MEELAIGLMAMSTGYLTNCYSTKRWQKKDWWAERLARFFSVASIQEHTPLLPWNEQALRRKEF